MSSLTLPWNDPLSDDAFDIESTEFAERRTFVAVFIPWPVLCPTLLFVTTLLGQVMS